MEIKCLGFKGGAQQPRKILYRKALLYEYLTVGYNLIEALASLIAGKLANGIALTGFSLDSIVESLSGLY